MRRIYAAASALTAPVGRQHQLISLNPFAALEAKVFQESCEADQTASISYSLWHVS